MPTSNDDAARELRELAKKASLTGSSLARKVGKSPRWVQRRFNGDTRLSVDDYNLLRNAIEKQS